MIGLSFLVIISTTCNPRIGSESDPATGVPVAPSGAVLPFAAPIVKVLLLVFGAAIFMANCVALVAGSVLPDLMESTLR